jgi:hypothetical protein
MMKIFSFFLIAALYAIVPSSGADSCPGGYSEGTQMDQGRYWYECRNGKMTPKGCLAEDGHRVEIGGTFDTAQYRVKCVQGSDGFMTMVFQACVFHGSAHEVASQWDDGTAFHTCVREGNNVRVITLGCVDQSRPVKLDERVAKGDFIYQCKKATDGTPTMNKVGCVHEGRKLNIGETLNGPKVWYTCTDSGLQIIGCMYNSNRMGDNDYYAQGDYMYTCKVDGERTGFVQHSCVTTENGVTIEKKMGCLWSEDRGSQTFEFTCKDLGSGKLAKVQTQCIYKAPQGQFKIPPGCVRSSGTIAVGCLDSGSGELRTETYSVDSIDRLPGLRQC